MIHCLDIGESGRGNNNAKFHLNSTITSKFMSLKQSRNKNPQAFAGCGHSNQVKVSHGNLLMRHRTDLANSNHSPVPLITMVCKHHLCQLLSCLSYACPKRDHGLRPIVDKTEYMYFIKFAIEARVMSSPQCTRTQQTDSLNFNNKSHFTTFDIKNNFNICNIHWW